MVIFSFRKIAHRCIVCVTQSNWVKCDFHVFHVLPGSAEAQVIWGGIVKRLLIAYFISNISAKNMSKSIHVRQSYSEPKVGRFFETRCTCVVVCLTAVVGCCISSQDSVAGTDGREARGTGCMHCEGFTVDRLRKGTYLPIVLAAAAAAAAAVFTCHLTLFSSTPLV